MDEKQRIDTRFVIIGAGISGVLMAIKLLERGYRNIVILEKATAMGGTWRDNVYPGVACDVAAHLYVYSFAPNPAWRSRYAKGADIQAYYVDVARRYGVLPLIHYGQDVASATLDQGRWRVETSQGATYHADIVIGATGRLHHPVVPAIAGADTFAGRSFHTARWDAAVDLTGKRVGLIGTGSTATQIIASTADGVGQLKIFQRTPQWVYPLPDTKIPWWRRWAMHLSRGYARRHYYRLRGETEARGKAAIGDATARAARDRMCHDALATIRDPDLRAKLTPDYEVGCKRLVFSPNFYDAIQKRTVALVTETIARIVPAGVETSDGQVHDLDVLVYATGFDAHAYLRPMALVGQDGVTLDQVWADLPLCYRSMAIPHMPNFFLINGPYSPGGTASVVGIVEAQVDYLLQLIETVVRDDVLIAPREAAAHAWLDDVRERARSSVWATGGCVSWYLDQTGTPTIDPTTLTDLLVQLAQPDMAAFDVQPRALAQQTAAPA